MTERPGTGDRPTGQSRRVKVVLADRRPAPAPVTARSEVDEQTEIGRLLVRGLMRAQLALGVRVAVAAVVFIGIWPLVFAIVPAVTRLSVLGVGLPWWILAVWAPAAAYGLARYYVRRAAAQESEFTELISP